MFDLWIKNRHIHNQNISLYNARTELKILGSTGIQIHPLQTYVINNDQQTTPCVTVQPHVNHC